MMSVDVLMFLMLAFAIIVFLNTFDLLVASRQVERREQFSRKNGVWIADLDVYEFRVWVDIASERELDEFAGGASFVTYSSATRRVFGKRKQVKIKPTGLRYNSMGGEDKIDASIFEENFKQKFTEGPKANVQER